MAIDYIINHACTAKDELGAEGIIHLVKSRARGQSLLDRFMKEGMTREEALHATFGMQVHYADGQNEMKRVSVAQLLREAELLQDHEAACKNCPVSFQRPFGCYGSINYPLSEQADEWLAKMAAKAVPAGFPNAILLKFILDNRIEGQTFKGLRATDGQRYLQGEYGMEVEIEDDVLGNALIDTDQLLEMFFAVGEMGDVHQQFLLFFSGGLTIQDLPPAQERIGVELQYALLRDSKGTPRFWVYRMTDELTDDYTVKQFKAYLRSVFAAQSVGATLTVDC